MKVIQRTWHVVQMACSPRYATKYRVDTTLAELEQEIARCHHADANPPLLRVFVERIRELDPKRVDEAVQLLAMGNNFDCKAYAIELDPTQGKTCGDQLMETVRENLQQYGRPKYAIPARKKLLLARKWYRISGALTQNLADEIKAGLDLTKWVLPMVPELVDPENP